MTIPYEIIPYDTIQWHVPHHTMSYHGCCYRRRYHTVPCHGRATVTQLHVVTVGSSFILASVDLVGWSGLHTIPDTIPYHTILYRTGHVRVRVRVRVHVEGRSVATRNPSWLHCTFLRAGKDQAFACRESPRHLRHRPLSTTHHGTHLIPCTATPLFT